jgi:micrococcal nuclease
MIAKAVAVIVGIIFLIIASFIVLGHSEYSVPTNSLPVQKTTCRGNFTATVKRVIDGDTLELQECDRHIRLSLVNTPEYYQAGYKEATDFTASLCEVGSQALISQDQLQPYDRYGRIVALVFCQNKNLNAEILQNNLGSVMKGFCSTSEFAKENWAVKDCS